MYSTHLKQRGFGFDEAKLQRAWESAQSIIAKCFRKPKRVHLDPETFAVEACAPGRHVLKLGDGFRNVADELKKKLCRVTEVNLASTAVPPLPENVSWFDEILLLGVLERLPAPQTFLQELRRRMAPRGSELVITTPNAVSFATRLMLTLADIGRERRNVQMIRKEAVFTFKTLRALLQQTGYELVEARGLPVAFQTAAGDRRWTRALLELNQLLLKVSQHLFAEQICFRARPISGVREPQVEVAAEETEPYPQMLGRVTSLAGSILAAQPACGSARGTSRRRC
jgi:hypothetical protein